MTTVNDDVTESTDEDTVLDGASRPLRKDALRNRQALLAAGREVFAERGLDASLDDIAHRAGLGVGTAYRHFGNKHELARAIFTAAVDDVIALAEQAAADADPWSGLVRFLEGAAAAQAADRGLREVMMGFHDELETTRINNALTTSLNQLVTAAKAKGQLREDAEASDVGVVVLMLCTVADVFGDYSSNLWRRYLPILLDGLRPGGVLPEPPLDDELVREAFASHKQRLAGRAPRV
ncbi:transcriptional regulator, TetR family [Jatrophihabitans endophyticus]|uniref:Transcriptional regulator, TetR family n=1 Tax=Jatrophihabitans endophyticus TaxID=1206085 RepID=A0A1M5HMH4_9ACTN|nr:TetR/AcrR family transcriptional regulator [Jatrophihabitans endophyticus]SHG17140.1 transcriptional regulator, TetR family [Jatrophihabitans endophyticus]